MAELELRELPYLQDTPFTADHCVKCNVCTQACPVVAVTDLFPGPKTVGPQAQRFREPTLPSADKSLDYCSSCGICTLVCPHGVRVMEINTQAKAKLAEQKGFNLRSWVLEHNSWWGVLGTPFAPLLNWLFEFKPFRTVVEKTLGVSSRVAFPKWAGYTFSGWWNRNKRKTSEAARIAGAPTVVFFHGCSTNTYDPRLGKLAVKILEHNGFNVLVPEQDCCGLPMQSNGDFAEARKFAQRNTSSLARFARQGIPIVGISGSCITALKNDYEHILDMHDEETHVVAAGVYDISEFLLKLYQQGNLRIDFKAIDAKIPYHAPCQLKAHGFGRPALDLFDLIPNLHVWEVDADCCGIAGTYGYKAEKRDIAEQVGAHLFKRIRESGASMAVCDTETCRWHIAQMTGKTLIHPIELIAQAYGITVEV